MKKLMMTLDLAMTMSMAANAQVNPTGCQQKKECCKKQGDKKDCKKDCKMAAECKKQCDKKQCDKKQCDKKQCDKKAGTCCKKQEKK